MVPKSGSPGHLLSHLGAVLCPQVQGESMSPEQDGRHQKEGHGTFFKGSCPSCGTLPFFTLHWLQEGREMWPQT